MQYSLRLGESQKQLLTLLARRRKASAESISEKLGWTEVQTEKALWRSYGIIAVVENHFRRSDGTPCLEYTDFFIPDENKKLVASVLKNGGARFRKEVEQ